MAPVSRCFIMVFIPGNPRYRHRQIASQSRQMQSELQRGYHISLIADLIQ